MQINQKALSENYFQTALKSVFEVKEFGNDFALKFEQKIVSQKKEQLIDQQRALLLLGQEILINVNIGKLHQYKQKISEFFDSISKETYSFSEERFTDNNGYNKYYSIINTVNEELDDLMKLTKDQEKNQIEILSKIGNLNGMILNIVI